MTLNDFINKSGLPAKLVRSTVRQIGGWEEFKRAARDIARHGANGGFHGFVYYTDTVAFTKRNKIEIITLAERQAYELGEDDVISMIAGFRSLNDIRPSQVARALYDSKSEAQTEVFNTLAWYALEEVARAYDGM